MEKVLILAGNTGLTSIIFLVIMFALMYFMTIRPAKKQQKEYDELMASLAVGDRVILRSGLHGVIDEIDDLNKTITLDCEGIYLVYERSAVYKIANKANASTSADESLNEPGNQAEVNQDQDDSGS